MLAPQQILHALDHANDNYYCHFVELGHAYSYLIDSRLNLFRAQNQWAIAVERLGYSPRAGSIGLEIFYYGNCLINLETYNNRQTNYYALDVIDWESWQAATKDELLNPAAETILVRDTPVRLIHDKAVYAQAGIELVEYEPGRITPDELGRLLILDHAPLFRATDAELYKSIPANLAKILVLDEWYHKDFVDSPVVDMPPAQLADTYGVNKASLTTQGISHDDLARLIAAQNQRMMQQNLEAWEQDRPSSYETWTQLAQVVATGDVRYYRPTLPPNTHWRNWPESGSL